MKYSTDTPLSQSCVSQNLSRIRWQCLQLMAEGQANAGAESSAELALEIDHSFNPYDSGP
jgi:hypothetical protein